MLYLLYNIYVNKIWVTKIKWKNYLQILYKIVDFQRKVLYNMNIKNKYLLYKEAKNRLKNYKVSNKNSWFIC